MKRSCAEAGRLKGVSSTEDVMMGGIRVGGAGNQGVCVSPRVTSGMAYST